MAAITELDFALASFWEFARIWRAGRKCKLIFTCEGGHGEVHVVAGLGATEEPHFPPVDGQVQGYRRKKTPSQLRREERRRVEKRAEKAQVGKVNEAKPADKVSQADGYVDTDKASLEEKNVAEEESMKAAKATEVSDKNKDVEEHEDEIGMSTLQDEICPDDIYVECS